MTSRVHGVGKTKVGDPVSPLPRTVRPGLVNPERTKEPEVGQGSCPQTSTSQDPEESARSAASTHKTPTWSDIVQGAVPPPGERTAHSIQILQ